MDLDWHFLTPSITTHAKDEEHSLAKCFISSVAKKQEFSVQVRDQTNLNRYILIDIQLYSH